MMVGKVSACKPIWNSFRYVSEMCIKYAGTRRIKVRTLKEISRMIESKIVKVNQRIKIMAGTINGYQGEMVSSSFVTAFLSIVPSSKLEIGYTRKPTPSLSGTPTCSRVTKISEWLL